MLNIQPRGAGREISNSLNRLFKEGGVGIWGGLNIPHFSGKRETKKKKNISLTAPGRGFDWWRHSRECSIWTWLTQRHTEHSSLAAMQEWDAHRKLWQHFYLKRHLGNIFTGAATTYLQLFLKAHLDTSPTLPQSGINTTAVSSSHLSSFKAVMLYMLPHNK